MEDVVAGVAHALGLSHAVARFLLAYILTIPCSALARRIPPSSPSLRHVFGALSGLALSFFAFDLRAIFLLLLPTAFAYLCILYAPRSCGVVTFLGSFAFLIACHVAFMSGDEWKSGGMDCTGALMILTLKVTSCAMDYQDGVSAKRRDRMLADQAARAAQAAQAAEAEGKGATAAAQAAEVSAPAMSRDEGSRASDGKSSLGDLAAGSKKPGDAAALKGQCSSGSDGKPSAGAEAKASTGAEAKASTGTEAKASVGAAPVWPKALKERPSVLQFVGYCFYCGLHFAGPFYFFKDYKNWAEGTENWAWERGTARRPPFVFPLLKAFSRCVIAAVAFLYLSSFLDISVFSHAPIYFALPLWRRLLLILLVGSLTRWKFYFVWSISEAAMIAGGLGFSGWQRKQQPNGSFREVASWEGAVNANWRAVEFATSTSTFAINWNVSVGRWLRTYVYERIVPFGKKPRFEHLLITQIVSAVWHGLYPGYILFFTGVALEVAGSRVIYRWQKSMDKASPFILALCSIAHGLYASFCNNFFAVGFILLSAHDTLTAWRGLYFLGIILPLSVILLNAVAPPQKHKPKSS